MDRLADLNTILALIDPVHLHNPVAKLWFEQIPSSDRVCLCRVTQMGLLRLLSSTAVMGQHALTLKEAWATYARLLQHPKWRFLKEPVGFERTWMRLCLPNGHSPKVVTDAYLAAIAIEGKIVLTTFDRGFNKFQGMSLELLSGQNGPS